MTIRTFWTLFLKILGIWLILSGLTVIPQFISAWAFFGDNLQDNFIASVYITAILLITIGIYFVIMKLFIFNSSWLINKLKLDTGYQEDKLDLNIKLNTVLSIATIVIGGLILVDALPMLCKEIFTFIQRKTVFRQDPEFSWIIFYSIKVFVGYILMTNSNLVTNYITKKTDKIEG